MLLHKYMQVGWHRALLTLSVEGKPDQAWVAIGADEFERASLPEQGSWSVLSESILQEVWVLYQSIRPIQASHKPEAGIQAWSCMQPASRCNCCAMISMYSSCPLPPTHAATMLDSTQHQTLGQYEAWSYSRGREREREREREHYGAFQLNQIVIPTLSHFIGHAAMSVWHGSCCQGDIPHSGTCRGQGATCCLYS